MATIVRRQRLGGLLNYYPGRQHRRPTQEPVIGHAEAAAVGRSIDENGADWAYAGPSEALNGGGANRPRSYFCTVTWSRIKPSQPKWCLFGVYFWRVPKGFWRIEKTLETRLESTTDKAFKGNQLTGKNLQKQLSPNPSLSASLAPFLVDDLLRNRSASRRSPSSRRIQAELSSWLSKAAI